MASIYSLDSIVCDGHYVTVPFTKQLVLQSPINTLAQSGAMTKSHDTGNSARNSHSAANPATHLAPTTPTATHHIPRYIPAYIRRKRFAEAVALHLHTPIAYPHDTLAVHDLCVQPTANPESQTRKAVNLILQLPTKDPQNIHSRKIPATQGSHEVQLRKGISQHINRYSRPISAPSIAAKSQSTALSTHIYRGTDPSAPLQIHKGVNSWCPTRHYTSIIKPPSSRSARTTETGQTRPIIPQRPSSSRSAAYVKVYPAQGYHRYKSDLALLKPSSTKESGVKQETQDGISRPPSSQSTAISSRMVASTCAPALLPHEMTTMDTAVDTNHPSGFYNDLSAGVNRLNSGNPEYSGRGVRYLGDKRKPPDLPLVNRAPTDECFDMPELVIHWEAIQCGNPISDVHLSASATDVADRKRIRDEHTAQASSSGDNALPTSPIAPFSDGDFGEDTDDIDFNGIRDEAIVDMDAVDVLDQDEEDDEEGEDLFGDNLDNDYRENLRLDHYEVESAVDEEDFADMSREDRLVAEARMRRRDREMARLEGRLPAAFLDDDEEDADEPIRARRRRRDGLDMDIDLDAGEIAPLDPESLMATKGPLNEFVAMEGPRRTIKKEFHSFLTSYVNDKGESVYGERVKAMCLSDGQSLEVDYRHLYTTNATLAYFLSNTPTEILKIFDSVAMEVVLTGYEDYDKIRSEIHVRITNLPIVEALRELRQSHLNTLVNVRGVVTRRTGVPFIATINALLFQESPGTVPAGRLPRHREVILLWDLVDSARPGEEIEVVGVYRNNFDFSLNTKNGFPVFATIIEANHISRGEDLFSSSRLNEDDQREIRKLATDPRIRQRIIKSVFKNPQGKHRLRGDINVLLLGDPGTAKSQFLKYIEKTSPRAVYTTGQGASAVGLTAAVHKDVVTREWTLEGGALVMADRGVCLIDEFDKMNDQDRTSIHEAMEQQSISISKAGIVATLQARCAVISAANPIYGKYNPQVPFSQNVELTEPILSRFDILCVVRDTADPVVDERLARFVCGSHMRSHPGFTAEDSENGAPKLDSDIIPQDFLRKYIIYAREHVRPTLRDVDVDKLEKLYSELRRESMIGGAIPITVRYLESIIRMSEAFARMHLRDTVRQDDIDHAISVTIRSFISAQKHSVKKSLSRVFDKYITTDADMHELLNHVLSDILKEHMRFEYLRGDGVVGCVEIDCEEFGLRAKEHRVFDLASYYESELFMQSFTLDTVRNKIVSRS
ncbi:hypothetical protein BASA81_013627 [Batrachochytrium salamandrivorans]|nr:hypothetical protein BASA81_013627 [Batrachochytrium salamandrivorans]